jgi:hypothetical protein
MINNIFKNNTMIKILAIQLLNTVSLLVFNVKSLLKIDGVLGNFSALFGVP